MLIATENKTNQTIYRYTMYYLVQMLTLEQLLANVTMNVIVSMVQRQWTVLRIIILHFGIYLCIIIINLFIC